MNSRLQTLPNVNPSLAALTLCLAGIALAPAAPSVVESARGIPLAHDVDIVIAGASTGAVAAAVEAASQGAKVFLAAPRPYLGEDVTGTLRLWLEEGEEPTTALEKAIFEQSATPGGFPNRLDFTYQADQKANPKHGDSGDRILRDDRWESASGHSVQYDADVTITADLGKVARIKELHLLAFERDDDFVVGEVEVWTSPDGKRWRDMGKIEERSSAGTGDRQIHMSKPVKQPSRYVKLLVKRAPGIKRILLGELVLVEDGIEAAPDAKRFHPPTPMQVKIALDKALIDAGVSFLYGSMPTEILRDASGNAAGIVIANRAGRQAIRAKAVIDATPRATVARNAGAKFASFPAGNHIFERVVIGGEPRRGDNIKVRKLDFQFPAKGGLQDIFHYHLEIPMKDASLASFAAAENFARELTFDAALADESDCLFQVPPDPVVALKSLPEGPVNPESLDLKVLQPAGEERLFILGGCAAVSRDAAATLLRPLAQMRLGRRLGAATATLAAKLDAPSGVRVASRPPAKAARSAEIREFLQGTRPTDRDRPTLPSPQRSLPVLGDYDVVVVGGGTGGAPAAIAAARKDASTLVIEYQDHLGGVGTLGLISTYYHGYRKGFTVEVDKGVKEMGGPQRKGGWNPVTKREWWRREIRKAGGDIWFSTLGCGALIENGAVVGVVVATPAGRGVVLAGKVVDSTGNADIAAAAGAECITTSAEHIAMQGTGLSPKALGTGYTNTDYSFSDESDPVDQMRMIVSARQKFRNSYDLSTFIDSRERRRIVGDQFITPLDIVNNRDYDDTIALHQSNFDTHGYTVHPFFLINAPDKKSMTARVPYRALLPQGLDGIIVTGLAISAHRDAMPILRMQPCIQNQGYAAGLAAAVADSEDKSLRSINIRGLQQHLVKIGSLPPAALDALNSDPADEATLAAAVKSVAQDYRGLALVLEQADKALPLLRDAHAATDAPSNKLIYANILGMLGDPTGADTLIATIKAQDWDKGWNFRGMGQFGGSISPLDSHIIALGRSGAKNGLPVILAKLAQLDSSSEFSHHRAVAMALEELRDPAAAKPLADLLSRDGMTGFAIITVTSDIKPGGSEHRSQPLREIILARALFRCGDHDDLGQQILRDYQHDLRGLFAKHADAVLRDPR